MSSRITILLIYIARLSGCASTPKLDSEMLYELGERLARSVCPGPPTQSTAIANRHVTGKIDQIETRICSSGVSEIYVGETASDPNGLALSVEIIAPGVGLPPSLEIGRPLGTAIRLLGPPELLESESATYSLSTESDSSLTIKANADKIISVLWLFYVE